MSITCFEADHFWDPILFGTNNDCFSNFNYLFSFFRRGGHTIIIDVPHWVEAGFPVISKDPHLRLDASLLTVHSGRIGRSGTDQPRGEIMLLLGVVRYHLVLSYQRLR